MDPIVFQNISHYFSKSNVLNNIDLSFKKNSITAIIGKSGSGKSTLLQMINGLIIPTHGQVFAFGHRIDYSRLIELRLSIGYSVQGTGLFPHLTVYENIALLARVNGYAEDKIDVRIKKLMRFVDLDVQMKDKYPYQLSGGEQQRVGICRAMVLNPKVFLLDEAFGSLDPSTRNEIHLELLNLQKAEPRTIILVTHDLSEAIKLADYLVVIDNGNIQQNEKTRLVLDRPANAFVQGFIKSQLGER